MARNRWLFSSGDRKKSQKIANCFATAGNRRKSQISIAGTPSGDRKKPQETASCFLVFSGLSSKSQQIAA